MADSKRVPLYERLPDNAVRCYACGHRCFVRKGRRGICKVRLNQNGVLPVPYRYLVGLQIDPEVGPQLVELSRRAVMTIITWR